MPVIEIPEDGALATALEEAGPRLLIADFTATWCGPCHRIAPKFEELSNLYPKAVFVKVDVDKCQETAILHGVTAMPTFIFFRNRAQVDLLRGGDPTALETKVKEHAGPDEEAGEQGGIPGNIDLTTLIDKSSSECLNESDDHPFVNCLSGGEGEYLESDVDEQLIMSLGFNQAVKLHSLKIQAPKDCGPKTMKLFINHPNTLDFDQGATMEPVQTINFKPDDLQEGNVMPLRFVKFQNVQNIQVFVLDNQSGAETTRIDSFALYGRPVSTTNMSDFKRVAGKKGESH